MSTYRTPQSHGQPLWTFFLYTTLAATIVLCFVLPEVVVTEPEGLWNAPPAWKWWLLFGSYQGENMVYTVTHAARITLVLSLLSLLLSLIGGIALIFFNFYSPTRAVYKRITGAAVYFPRLFFLILISSLLSLNRPSELAMPADYYLVLLLGITGCVFLAAQTTGQVESIANSLFVHFAYSLRISQWQIFWRHILRNCTTLPVTIAKQLRDNVVFLSILTFIGIVHFHPEDLGALIYRLYGSPGAFYQGWWILFFPCAALCWLILLFDLVSEHLAQKMETAKQ